MNKTHRANILKQLIQNKLLNSLITNYSTTLITCAYAYVIFMYHRYMIRFTENENEADWLGYFYALLLFIVAVLQSLFLHQYFHRCFLIGLRMRTAVISAVYNKVCFECVVRSSI